MPRSFVLLFIGLAWASCVLAKQYGPNLPHPADPFLDPANDPYNPLGYIASNTLTAIAFSLIVASALWGAWWMSCMVIGEYTFSIGIGSRFGLTLNPESKAIYIVEYLFVVLSPCAFIAADYILLGRLARHVNAGQYLVIRPERVMITFLISDIVTFLIQAAGGGVSIGANSADVAKTGSNIFLGGLVIQLVSFVTFTAVFLLFLYRVRKFEPKTWARDAGLPWYHDWRALVGAMLLSCVGIIIRSVYRVIELSQGFEGPIARSERLFYGLDTLPLFIAVVVYVPFWPGRFISPSTAQTEPVPEADVREKTSEDVA
ncbi:RTA1-like protein [Amylostereum chailletii]|nr:RTA1-like protein [Amylostereum chailletii]